MGWGIAFLVIAAIWSTGMWFDIEDLCGLAFVLLVLYLLVGLVFA